MKTIIILIITFFFTIQNINAGETTDCREYKISIKALKCNLDRVGGNAKEGLITKKEGTLNFLGKWYKAKSLTDLKN